MRITMQSIHYNILTNLNKITSDMNRINTQISSGKQMSTISDDPVNLVTALGLRSNLTQITTYQDNLKFGDKTITTAENSLTQMKNLALRAKTLAIQQVNASVTPENRASAAEEVRHLWEQSIFLANSEVNGKYVFGGYRTTGYTATEPAPFIADKVDGYRINGNSIASTNQFLTSTVDNTPPADLAANDLLINGVDIGVVDLNAVGGVIGGLNMDGASKLAVAINGAATSPAVTANLTTLTYSSAATTAAAATGNITMTVNGAGITVPVTLGDSIATVNAAFVAAVNSATGQTGVIAAIGNGANGAANNTLILKNAQAGDNSVLDITAFNDGGTGTNINFAVAAQSADATHNTGQISLSSTDSFTITTSAVNDTILARIGLGGGSKGFADAAGDGTLRYGSALAAGDLTINGTAIAATANDGLSTVYADASAAAKAKAINDLADTTGVSADITPVYHTASGSAIAGTLHSGDLVINGVDIFDGSSAINADPATIIAQDTDNTIIDAINAKSGSTGIVATRDSDGIITLSAKDGRNLQLETSANGENITHLNGAATDTPASAVYFGTIQLASDHQFFVETTPIGTAPNISEPGLEALGLAGGAASTGESKDLIGDGQLQVLTIQKKDGNVRYAGDPDHDLAIKVGKGSTLEVSKNGKSAVSDTGIFTTLKQFENALRGQKFGTVTGIHKATDITAKLDSGNTGLEQQFKSFTNGAISVTVKDHSYYPPRDFTMDVGVNTATDSPASIAGKINGIPGMTAAWSADGALKLETIDTERYSFTYEDTSGFLDMTGITNEQMQIQSLERSISDFDTVMESMTSRISDFGARSNRIIVQQQIYANLELSTKTNLSEKEDTDITKALLELKGKETAYEAALSSAAKTMQLSLVDFLQ
ncbi:MAG: flagellar hook-associated protein 3 [Desulfurivibrionaceae bacterium]|jgi:flagellar hook-associated protein 3 FlgL